MYIKVSAYWLRFLLFGMNFESYICIEFILSKWKVFENVCMFTSTSVELNSTHVNWSNYIELNAEIKLDWIELKRNRNCNCIRNKYICGYILYNVDNFHSANAMAIKRKTKILRKTEAN